MQLHNLELVYQNRIGITEHAFRKKFVVTEKISLATIDTVITDFGEMRMLSVIICHEGNHNKLHYELYIRSVCKKNYECSSNPFSNNSSEHHLSFYFIYLYLYILDRKKNLFPQFLLFLSLCLIILKDILQYETDTEPMRKKAGKRFNKRRREKEKI